MRAQKLPRSQVGRLMFARAYRYPLPPLPDGFWNGATTGGGTAMRKSTVVTVSALAFMLLLLLGTSHALAACDHLIFVDGTYDLSANFFALEMTIGQSTTFFSGTLDDDTRINDGSIICSSPLPVAITFTRVGVGFTQRYTGTIVEKPLNPAGDTSATLLYGTFNHNGIGTYGWYARLQQ
jgi:hypothetical protein